MEDPILFGGVIPSSIMVLDITIYFMKHVSADHRYQVRKILKSHNSVHSEIRKECIKMNKAMIDPVVLEIACDIFITLLR